MEKTFLPRQLEEQKKKLKNDLARLEAIEAQEVINQNYERIKKKYEGKYFKCENGYNAEDRWWIYIKVTEIAPDDVYDTHRNGVTSRYKGWNFQTDTEGQITIEKEKHGYIHGLGKEISERKFIAAWNKMVEKMNAIEKD